MHPYVDQLGGVARLQVPEDGRLVEVGQVGHVLALLELGRVDLRDQLALDRLFLQAEIDLW